MNLPPELDRLVAAAPARMPVLLAGPTASGKSDMALALVKRHGGAVVNADALQVYDCWQILTARPDSAALGAAQHLLYGHITRHTAYSVGHWLRDLAPLLAAARDGTGPRPVITGGTGLYFAALTEGLAEIPPVPSTVRAASGALLAEAGIGALLAQIDPATRAGIDPANPARVRRAWEVAQATGDGLAAWKARTGAPLLPAGEAVAVAIHAGRDWLDTRITARLDRMLATGALDEVRANLPHWQEGAPWTRAIGAAEFAAHLRGITDLETALDAARTASRRYAKRQRSWIRSRGDGWHRLELPG